MRQLERPDAFEQALLEERPEISASFAEQLDAWAAEGFPAAAEVGRPEHPSRFRAFVRRVRERPLTPALAGGATIVLAVAVSATVLLSEVEDRGSVLDQGSGDAPTQDRSLEATPQSGGGRPAAPPPGSIDPFTADQRARLKPGEPRIREQTVSTTLSTDPDEVDDVADGIVEVTERYDGIVGSSRVSTGSDGGRATFALKVPAQNLQAFMADLSDLAGVKSRDEGTLDITAPFVSAEERFADAKAEVDSLVGQLADADSTSEIDEIKARLATARAELATARAELASLKQRADFATVSVAVVGEGDTDGRSLGDALDDALSVLEDIVGAGLVALAVLVPFTVVGAAIWFGARRTRRRSRERALDD